MSDIDWGHLAIVTAVHGEKYIGWVPDDVADPKAYLDEHGEAKKPIVLHNVRNMVGQATPNWDPTTGQMMGLAKMLILLPIDVMNGPLPTLHVIPSAWYFPGEHEDVKQKVERLFRQAADLETRMSAAEAGILPATPIMRRT